jgi:hypothetical protein
MGVSGQLYAPAVLSLGKSPWYPLNTRLVEPQGWSGSGGEEENSLHLPGIESQSVIYTECENWGWIELARGRVQWQAFMNTTMNLRIHQ